MSTVDRLDYNDISESVRRFCAERLHELEKSLRPLVDGSFGEVVPGHLNGYLATIRQLGRLYQVERPPIDLANMVPMVKVQELLARMEAQRDADVAAAVAAAEERVRREISAGSQLSIQTAMDTVSTKLMELEKRARS